MPAEDRAPHARQAELGAGIADEVAGREIVGPVDDEVVARQDGEHVRRLEPHVVRDDGDVGVERAHGVGRGVDLAPPDVRGRVEDLPLEVGDVDDVIVDDPERPHARGREVEQRGRAEPARPDDEHARGEQPPLPVDPDLRERELPRVARGLRARERRALFDERSEPPRARGADRPGRGGRPHRSHAAQRLTACASASRPGPSRDGPRACPAGRRASGRRCTAARGSRRAPTTRGRAA